MFILYYMKTHGVSLYKKRICIVTPRFLSSIYCTYPSVPPSGTDAVKARPTYMCVWLLLISPTHSSPPHWCTSLSAQAGAQGGDREGEAGFCRSVNALLLTDKNKKKEKKEKKRNHGYALKTPCHCTSLPAAPLSLTSCSGVQLEGEFHCEKGT